MHYITNVAAESKWALGHSFFGNLPGLLMFSTVWIREHNRVCDVLKNVHPDWDDERLYQTTKLITLGKSKFYWPSLTTQLFLLSVNQL